MIHFSMSNRMGALKIMQHETFLSPCTTIMFSFVLFRWTVRLWRCRCSGSRTSTWNDRPTPSCSTPTLAWRCAAFFSCFFVFFYLQNATYALTPSWPPLGSVERTFAPGGERAGLLQEAHLRPLRELQQLLPGRPAHAQRTNQPVRGRLWQQLEGKKKIEFEFE